MFCNATDAQKNWFGTLNPSKLFCNLLPCNYIIVPSNSITSHLPHQSSEKALEILDLYRISCFSKLEFLAPTRKTEPSAMTYDPVAWLIVRELENLSFTNGPIALINGLWSYVARYGKRYPGICFFTNFARCDNACLFPRAGSDGLSRLMK